MIKIFKIGGNVINDPEELKAFLKEFSKIEGKKVLVHGGGKEATEMGRQTGHEAPMIEGRRVTDSETLKLVTMVYAGLINKRIVSLLQEMECNAVGLTGADGNLIPATKRNPEPIDYGYVGDIDPQDINTNFLDLLLSAGMTPVVCAICRDKNGGLLNCNADSIASALAEASAKKDDTELVFCFEKAGVMENPEAEDSVIPLVTSSLFEEMRNAGKITGGMLPKVTNALKAVGKGVKSVRICSSKNFNQGKGTVIR